MEALLLGALGVAGLAGGWPQVPAGLLLALLLWTPGAVLRRALLAGSAAGAGTVGTGPGCLSLQAALSLALLTLTVAPLYLTSAPLAWAPRVLGASFVLIAAVALRRGRKPTVSAPFAEVGRTSASGAGGEWAAFALALIVLLPTLLHSSGGNVDDWWDLAFVRSWIAQGRFSVSEPFLGSGQWHPRFLWSVWLVLQSIVGAGHAEDLWRLQAGPLAAAVCTMVVSAFAALARSLFGPGDPRTIATILAVPLWLWGTEEIPFFARAYQDKLVAGFALAPLLLAVVVDAVEEARARRRRGAWIAVAAVATATVSVHSLVYTMAVLASLLVVLAHHGRGSGAWLRSRPGIALLAALGAPALYPLGQALALAVVFGAQGIGLTQIDNPVVRAHLALGRILWSGSALEAADRVSPWWIVHPGAVFGPIAVVAAAGLVLAWKQRERTEARVLMLLTVVPCLLLFTPGLAGLAGRLWVPWMLYRLGWLVPVAALLGFAVGEGWRRRGKARAVSLALAAAALLIAAGSGADRLRRDMAEHPGPPSHAPRGSTLEVYRFLGGAEPSRADAAGRPPATVLAPPGLAELVPALSGRPVVAFTERGTLVFALDEKGAYARLRDRGRFFSSDADPAERSAVADRYGARWAVLPRGLVAGGSEERWIRRFGAESLLAARTADREGALWSSHRQGLVNGLGPGWRVVLENPDWFVVERDPAAAAADHAAAGEAGDGAETRGTGAGGAGDPMPAWLSVLQARPTEADDPEPQAWGEVLASVATSPGARASFAPPPQLLTPVAQPIWIGGAEPWEDVPAEASLTLDIGVGCRVAALRVIPYAPRPRREALEVTVDGRRSRIQAIHGRAIDIELDPSLLRSRVTVQVRSLLGNPVSLSDVQLLGPSSSCSEAGDASRDANWPVYPRPELDILEPDEAALQTLAFEHPTSGRPFLSLARRAARSAHRSAGKGKEDGGTQTDAAARARALLVEATRREPSLVQAWIDLGFNDDAAGKADQGIDDFDAAMAADSHSAWAHGCAAWARYRGGRTIGALWHALRARSLDPYYADAWTLIGYVAHRVGLEGVAQSYLDGAERIDPDRNWPVLARAEFAAERGDKVLARQILETHLARVPYDSEARARLADIDEAPGSGRKATR